MRKSTVFSGMLLICASGFLLGCPKKTPPPQPTPIPEATPEPTPEAPTCDLETIYFDFDQSSLRADARSTLSDVADCMRSNSGWDIVTIEGHCDERGSTDYNLALGERRAQSVRNYLVSLGVSEGRLRTISYGEERPVAHGTDDDSWSQNRRAEFRY